MNFHVYNKLSYAKAIKSQQSLRQTKTLISVRRSQPQRAWESHWTPKRMFFIPVSSLKDTHDTCLEEQKGIIVAPHHQPTKKNRTLILKQCVVILIYFKLIKIRCIFVTKKKKRFFCTAFFFFLPKRNVLFSFFS